MAHPPPAGPPWGPATTRPGLGRGRARDGQIRRWPPGLHSQRCADPARGDVHRPARDDPCQNLNSLRIVIGAAHGVWLRGCVESAHVVCYKLEQSTELFETWKLVCKPITSKKEFPCLIQLERFPRSFTKWFDDMFAKRWIMHTNPIVLNIERMFGGGYGLLVKNRNLKLPGQVSCSIIDL